MITMQETHKKRLYAVFKPECPEWVKFKPLWEQLAREYPSVDFIDVDGTTPAGEEYARKRFVRKSPTIISNEGFRLEWHDGIGREEFVKYFLNQETTFNNVN